ncbi:TPA: DUF305 domain-containing protein [Candidatus Woesearchaeota archaeon]|nr:hypothetical protein [uncultured archaeon]MBS3174143.1 DUF305 domain-containing protein [Candidatus Woesearchaeota archaeon]AQS34894.1 hypothetical protein [uncultured archaeon]HIH32337.1 DUF305 domain-containing protein [Candidatus Woesearchaeota archaeon]HIH55220.1 DUF305 domain-containing protein [Candidatus Woesearchaeota archaeon]
MGILRDKKIAVALALIVMIVGSIAYFITDAYLMGYDEEEFIKEMIIHHEEAVISSRIMLNSEDQKVRDLANNIVDAQEKEISLLESWLSEWYPESKQINSKSMMPKLSSQASKERDILYLKGMIKHHEDAIMMAEKVLKTYPRSEVQSLAENIINVQSQEIILMDSIIKNMNGVLI